MLAEHKGLTVLGKHGPRWNGEVRFLADRLAEPLSWRKPRKVFVNSMSDLFHESLPFETIAAIFGVMAASPAHTFQVLTKRPQRAREFFTWAKARARDESPSDVCLYEARMAIPEGPGDPWEPRMVSLGLDHRDEEVEWPLPNVWLGVSAEDQATADERIPHLLACPAAVRWVSYEPALGPVGLARWLTRRTRGEIIGDGLECLVDREALSWVIAGGESGPGARPFDLAWARSVIAQCREAGVACFVKQLGAVPVSSNDDDLCGRQGALHDLRVDAHSAFRLRLRDRKGGDMSEWPEDLRVREWPKTTTEETDR